MKIAFKFASAVLTSSLLGLPERAVADPPPSGCSNIFCFRFTDIKCGSELGEYHFQFEVLNWSDAFAGGMKFQISPASSEGPYFADPYAVNGIPGIDQDLSPFIGSKPPGFIRDNTWNVKQQTSDTMEYEMGTPIPFVNLVRAFSKGQQDGCNQCTFANLPPESQLSDDDLSTDNGDNTQDGFVFTLRNLHYGDHVIINWFLTGADGATAPFETPFPMTPCRETDRPNGVPIGKPIGSQGRGNTFGFGLITLYLSETGAEIPFLPAFCPEFGQTGVRSSNIEFANDVWDVKSPDGENWGKFAMEFSGGVSLTGVKGDPHFKTWNKTPFDFHGECDLVLLKAFNIEGTGMDLNVHLRTTIMGDYSYVETAAIQMGEDILEVSSWGEYFINSVEGAELPATIGGFKVSLARSNDKGEAYEIELSEFDRIYLRNFKKFVAVDIQVSSPVFHNSLGLMGNATTGSWMARDGKTVLNNPIEFGQEWQVLDSEPKLFANSNRAPQHPQTCKMPADVTKDGRRMLRSTSISREAAEAACSHRVEDKEDCVFDVMATGDLDMALAGAF